MLLKITEKCSAGCTHCLSDCTPDGGHMPDYVLDRALIFITGFKLGCTITVTGGEPTEHPEFMKVMQKIIDWTKTYRRVPFYAITITSNGFWVVDHQDEAMSLVEQSDDDVKINWQISTDSRYYTKKLDTTKHIWRKKGFVLCEDCVQMIDYMGRARKNQVEGKRKTASSCFNLRAIAKQLRERNDKIELKDVITYMESTGHFCTPEIRINGDICPGESDLCPPISSVWASPDDVLERLINCKCAECKTNLSLPEIYRKLVNN